MSGANNFQSMVADFGASAKTSMRGPGEPEAQLTSSVEQFMRAAGDVMGLRVTTHAQVRELAGAVRPDIGVMVNGALTGHVELKAPGTSLDPATYGKSTHNFRQWQKLRELPNLLHTNGIEWRLWRYGELVESPTHVHAKSLTTYSGVLTAPPSLEVTLSSFLAWAPSPITSISKLVGALAPLARMLREEIVDALTEERRARARGASEYDLPLSGLSKDWRKLLFPNANSAEFADGFSQTVVFALLLAVSEGIDVTQTTLAEIARKLEAKHGLMGMSLKLLTEHIHRTTAANSVETIVRVLSAVDWEAIQGRSAKEDLYLHLYEHFLGEYDPAKRKATGSYYTPIEIVDFMVRITDDALKQVFQREAGLCDESVTVIDSSMGTGTYPLSILRYAGEQAAKQYGPGARAGAVTSMAERLYGIEIQSGPFAVAELRLTEAMKAQGAALPVKGLNMYVADTLEDPALAAARELSYTEQLIARQRIEANRIKRDLDVTVSIGNPPYREKSKGLGGWIESGVDPRTGESPLAAFQVEGNANHNQHLRNLYAYFWRWSTWKVFESIRNGVSPDGGEGIICYITATGYLNGEGFKGMREYLRRTCSHGWIINVSPEGRQPPSKNAVFNIQTPVAIGLFVRSADTRKDQPAEVKYMDVFGTRDEKFSALTDIQLQGEDWELTDTDWRSPFSPVQSSRWSAFPRIGELFPWVAPGVSANRTWVYSPQESTLEDRLRELVNEKDPKRKADLFSPSFHANLDKPKKPLPGVDVEINTQLPFRDVPIVTDPKIVRVGYRSLDRQYIIADSRLLHSPSSLWAGRFKGQVFATEMHTEHPGDGPGLSFSALLPDKHYFNNRGGGGRALPMRHPDGSVNVTPRLVDALSGHYNELVDAEDVFYYAAGVVAHSGYVETFSDDLKTPGMRIPITADVDLWRKAVGLGRDVVWLQTYGESSRHSSGAKNVLDTGAAIPVFESAVGEEHPADLVFDRVSSSLHVGRGCWSGVSQKCRNFAIGGRNVLDSWFGYRRRDPAGKRSSALNEILPARWDPRWSIELTELLAVISQLIEMEDPQQSLLEEVLGASKLGRSDLEGAGVSWPVSPAGKGDRAPRMPKYGEREARAILDDFLGFQGNVMRFVAFPMDGGWAFERLSMTDVPERYRVDLDGRCFAV